MIDLTGKAALVTGASSSLDIPFARTPAFFRLSAIFHGIEGRVIRGTASSADAEKAGA